MKAWDFWRLCHEGMDSYQLNTCGELGSSIPKWPSFLGEWFWFMGDDGRWWEERRSSNLESLVCGWDSAMVNPGLAEICGMNMNYCGWLRNRNHQLKTMVHPIFLFGFQPSKVVQDFATIHSMIYIIYFDRDLVNPTINLPSEADSRHSGWFEGRSIICFTRTIISWGQKPWNILPILPLKHCRDWVPQKLGCCVTAKMGHKMAARVRAADLEWGMFSAREMVFVNHNQLSNHWNPQRRVSNSENPNDSFDIGVNGELLLLQTGCSISFWAVWLSGNLRSKWMIFYDFMIWMEDVGRNIQLCNDAKKATDLPGKYGLTPGGGGPWQPLGSLRGWISDVRLPRATWLRGSPGLTWVSTRG